MNAVRVVFDSNIFAINSFEALERSALRRLFASGRILPIYGHVFIEETMRAYGADGKRELLVNRWLPFIMATCNSICNDFNSIFHEELVRGRGLHARQFMSRRNHDRVKEQLPKIPLDGTWHAWHASRAERDIEDEKRAAQRQISKEIRAEVLDWKRTIQYQPTKHGTPNLNRYIQIEIDNAGRDFIDVLVKSRNTRAIADRWSRNKDFYPYFTEFVRGMLYMAFYSSTKPNAPIDLNAQADLNVMAHLLHGDILVTNELGFLRTAFLDLWKPKGKVLMTGEQFMNYLNKF
ncbi:hypothetical protein [Duganella sp. LjRoot269]|uniref:hypothetical protein n=1 Tax=Duganella sp. LjRoot269 TaxID=3342305 RepID=UPI003ED06CC4